MRKTLFASVLMVALCGSAFAGDISCPPIAPGDINNPPATAQVSGEQAGDGSTDTSAGADGATYSGDADGFAATALTVFNSVLALL